MRVCLSYLIALPGIAGIAGVTSSRGIFYRATSLLTRRATLHTDAPQQAGNIVEKGHIYFVATPLGNLQDITFRAVNVLSNVDIVAAEDTRNTAKLLKLLNIKYGKLVSHHEHNWQSSTPELVRLLKEGSSVALVSDAGTRVFLIPVPFGCSLCSCGHSDTSSPRTQCCCERSVCLRVFLNAFYIFWISSCQRKRT